MISIHSVFVFLFFHSLYIFVVRVALFVILLIFILAWHSPLDDTKLQFWSYKYSKVCIHAANVGEQSRSAKKNRLLSGFVCAKLFSIGPVWFMCVCV